MKLNVWVPDVVPCCEKDHYISLSDALRCFGKALQLSVRDLTLALQSGWGQLYCKLMAMAAMVRRTMAFKAFIR